MPAVQGAEPLLHEAQGEDPGQAETEESIAEGQRRPSEQGGRARAGGGGPWARTAAEAARYRLSQRSPLPAGLEEPAVELASPPCYASEFTEYCFGGSSH